MNPPAYALLACEVFVDEIAALAGEPAPWRAAAWLEMGLHDHPDRLRAAIQTSITGLEADPQVEAIALAYGRCGNGLLGVRAGRVPLVLPQAHDCISILLGGVDRHNALLRENPGTYFCSPGWVREKRVPGPDRETYLRTLYGERYGDNVLTRIQYAIDRDGAGATLQSILLRGSLAPLLDQLLANAQLGPESLSECVATGNTVMLHTLAGAALDGFAAYPFKPAFLDAREFRSGDLGLPGDFPIRLAPHFGPFVGADILAGALASGLTRETGPALLIDFGTNGEILLKTRDGYLATATAAGPAFEGGRLHCGAPAAPGAIGRIARTADGWRTERIGGAEARPLHSLAGSAYVDFMAEALACGLINGMGRFDPAHPAVTRRAIDGERVPVAAITGRVFVSEPDIAELMQAKAAILGGAWTLLEEAGLATGDLQALYVAGGFGYHLDPAHAMAVGLLPSVPRQRIRVIGNASLAGASLLLQANVADDIAALRSACRVLELNQIESFEDHYIDAMALESG